jgi:putative addiction module component (TIGR02574 family)
MSKTLSDLESEARRLPVKDRARLIRRLLATLESENEGNVEQQWLDEAERRLAAYRRGETTSHPGEEVIEAILNRA